MAVVFEGREEGVVERVQRRYVRLALFLSVRPRAGGGDSATELHAQSEEIASRSFARGGLSFPRRDRGRPVSNAAIGGLRLRFAFAGGDTSRSWRYRQRTDGHSHPSGQRKEGSVRDALGDPARSAS